MATTPVQVAPNGSVPTASSLAEVQEIQVQYDKTNDCVILTPTSVCKGQRVRFKDPSGGALRIVFVSAMGNEAEKVSDSEVCTLSIGGAFHFKCYFTYPGAKNEISPTTGGVIDVLPHRP